MGGLGAVPSEVVRSGNQSFAKVMLPKTVDQHPRDERIARIGEPLGEGEPAGLPGSISRQLECRFECVDGRRRDGFSLLHGLAAMKPKRRRGRFEAPGVDDLVVPERSDTPFDFGQLCSELSEARFVVCWSFRGWRATAAEA